MFTDKMKSILENAGFWKTWLYSVMWNLQSRKFQAFVISSVFFYLRIIDQNTYLIILGIYMGSNIVDKVAYKMGGDK